MEVKDLKKKILPALKKNGVKKLSVFGSVARGDDRKGSDIDLLVEFKGQKSLMEFVGLKMDLESRLDRKVDLLTFDSINPLIRDRLEKDEVVIYG